MAKSIEKSNVLDILELSNVQKGMLFHYLRERSQHFYNIQLVFEINGELDPEIFQTSLKAAVAANECLRSVFSWEKTSQPVQIILKQQESFFSFTDLSGQMEAYKESWLEEFASQDSKERFDLSYAAWRIRLVKKDAGVYVLFVTHHHILYDGWSTGIFLKELFTNYQRVAENSKPLFARKADYKKAQQVFFSNTAAEESREFWKQYLGDGEKSYLVSKVTDVHGEGKGFFKISGTLAGGLLDEFASAERVTKAAIVYAAYAILLQKYTDSDNVVFGTAVSCRNADLSGGENVMGNFINTIPLRVENFVDSSLLEVVQLVNSNLRDRNEFNATSYYEIKQLLRLKPEEDLFDSAIVVENYPIDVDLMKGLPFLQIQLKSIYENTGIPILFTVFFNGGVTIELCCMEDHVSPAFADSLLQRFLAVIDAIVTNRHTPASALSILSPREQQRLLVEFNDTAISYDKDKTLVSLFEEQVARAPLNIALELNGQQLSYEHLNNSANFLAGLLRGKGVRPNDVVGLYLNRTFDMFISILAVLKAGACYLPLDTTYPHERLKYMLANSGAAILISDRKKVQLGEHLIEGVEILELGSHVIGSAVNPERVNKPEDLAYLIYTSGSTGNPKGVMLCHRSVHNYIVAMQKAIDWNGISTLLSVTSFSFDIFVTESFLPLVMGLKVVIADENAQRSPALLSKLIEEKGVQFIQTTPSRYRLLLADSSDPGLWRDQLRYLLVGGEALDKELFERLKHAIGARIVNVYGPTETTVWSTSMDITQESKIVIGKPLANTQIYILNKQLQLQPTGVCGELYIGGDGLSLGYWNRPELTEKSFVDNPYFPGRKMYKTGDIAKWLDNGTVAYVGRADHQVKVRGYRIELDEINYQLKQYKDISESVVVVKGSNADSVIVAYYVGAPEVKETELMEFLSGTLPAYMLPAYFVRLDEMPLTPNGKLDKGSLPDPSMPEEQVMAAEAVGSVENEILSIWKEVLGRQKISVDTNFFDIGGDSLKIINVSSKIRKNLKIDLSVTDLFDHPTIKRLAAYINRSFKGKSDADLPESGTAAKTPAGIDPAGIRDNDIAIIGMACRFPGASNPEQYWQNISAGKSSINTEAPGKDSVPGLIYAKGKLADYDKFDAAFFNYLPFEANAMDPQIRLFHECTWESLEDAGYNPYTYTGSIGLYGGASTNPSFNTNFRDSYDESWLEKWEEITYADKDFMCPRVSYKLNLKGPSINISTACSTSLVAVDMACAELLSGRCDMAIAGGVSITMHDNNGYRYHKSMIWSPDGTCRAFDDDAAGTVGGNGVGVVVLKKLKDALRDGDNIHAVIKGTASNNDGNRKVGFTAPSIEGQAKAIGDAIRKAGIPAESIGLVEAHGTGTVLGDPIEIEGLKRAFSTSARQFCAIGSVKTNIGHLDAAAGIAGLIKVVMSLKHRQLPPSLNFSRPNSRINFEESPFYVNATLRNWPGDQGPLRAGVSSFGIGGTNAHVVLEEAPAAVDAPSLRQYHPLLFSAQNSDALHRNIENFAQFLKQRDIQNLPDVAYTLQKGRVHFRYRKMIACSDIQGAGQLLAGGQGSNPDAVVMPDPFELVFMFTGQGSQYVNMCRQLYEQEPAFKTTVDKCFDILQAQCALDLKTVLFNNGEHAAAINETRFSQPALFVIEYAMALLLIDWGIRPTMMIGHSLGEYVAACISGVFSLADALKLVVNRGALMQGTERGAMLSVSIGEQHLRILLQEYRDISLAAVNSSSLCVVAGPEWCVKAFAQELDNKGIKNKLLHTSHAFHSSMMDAILGSYREVVDSIKLQAPQVPIVSNISGDAADNSRMCTSDYWVRHLREEVNFSAGIEKILSNENVLFIEVGPGNMLSTFVRSHVNRAANHRVVQLIRQPLQQFNDVQFLLKGLGEIWQCGVDVNWNEYYTGEKRNKLSLPVYSFDKVPFATRLGGKIKESAAALTKKTTVHLNGADDLEGEMAGLWEDFFGRKGILRDDDFFELGGDSLKALVLIARINNAWNVEISVSIFFNNPTIRSLAIVVRHIIGEDRDVPAASLFKGIPVAAERDDYRLSNAQQRLYFHFKFSKESIAYNLPCCFLMEGAVNIRRIEQVLNTIVARHEVLRTKFYEKDGIPYQRIIDTLTIPVEELRCSGEQLQQTIRGLIQPFDLNDGPLIRCCHVVTDDGQHVLFIDMHHIITDGYSHTVLIKEFEAVYNNIGLPELELQYKDFSEFQHSEGQQERIESQQDFWLREFAQPAAALDLPTDFARPALPSYEGEQVSFNLDRELTGKLKSLAEANNATLFMALLAVYNVLISKLTGTGDVVVGTPFNGRQRAELENMMGMFVNTLPIRNYPTGGNSFRKFLAGVRDKSLAAFGNQSYPFEKLVDDLGVVRNSGRNPLFDVMFAFQNFDRQTVSIDGVLFRPFSAGHTVAVFDLSLFAIEKEGELSLSFVYPVSLFTKETIEKYGAAFLQIIEKVLENADITIDAIDIVSPSERDMQLRQFNNTHSDINPEKHTVVSLFEKCVNEMPDNVALVYQDQQLTYRALNNKINAIAQKIGFEFAGNENKAVALLFDPSIEMIAAIFAVLRLGGAYLPLSPDTPAERNSYILENCDCALLLAQEAVVDEAYFNTLSMGDRLRIIGPDDTNAWRDYPEMQTSLDDLAYIIYTSGTSGLPKGVKIKHESLINYVLWRIGVHSYNQHDSAIQLLSYHFDGFVADLYPHLLVGAKITIVPKERRLDPVYIVNALEKEQVTNLALTPGLYAGIIQALTAENMLGHLRFAVLAGERASESLISDSRKMLPHVALHNQYGPTETTVGVLHNFDLREDKPNVIGKPIANTDVYILGGNNELMPVGFIGELGVSGICVSKGYVKNTALTREKFIENPYKPGSYIYKTGDSARWLQDGTIEFLGRKDNQVKIRGFRIELDEISMVLTKYNGIKQAVVISRDRADGSKYLAAFYSADERIDVAALQSCLQERLPEYMVPSYFLQLPVIPVTAVGKVDVKALPAVGTVADVEYVAAVSEEEKLLATVWAKVLGLQSVGVTDNFFAIGGDSIKSIQISARLFQLGYEATVKDIVLSQTIRELAKKMRRAGAGVEQSPVTGEVALTPVQQWFFEGPIKAKNHFNHAVILEFDERMDEASVTAIFEKLQAHHDALRMVYRTEAGRIRQYNEGIEVPLSLEVRDLSSISDPAETAAMIRMVLDERQESIDLERGPLMKLVLFHSQKGSRLLIVIHHLVIDGVSWRILFEDINSLYKQVREGEALTLPLKTGSYQAWAQSLKTYTASARFKEAAAYWKGTLKSEIQGLRRDYDNEPGRIEDVRTKQFVLSKPDTLRLITKVNHCLGTQINDILLAAFWLSLHKQYGNDGIAIDMEGHGRENIGAAASFGRTVGWFTSIYPVLLKLKSGDLVYVVKQVKELLRTIPNGGIDYLAMQYLSADTDDAKQYPMRKPLVSFNYLGQFDTQLDGCRIALDNKVGYCSGQESGMYDWDITGMINEGQLSISLRYFDTQYDDRTIESVLQYFNAYLVEIIDRLSSIEKSSLTPSDLSYKGLSIRKLDRLSAQYDIEDVYTLAPLQEGMLFHSLLDPSSDSYFGQMAYQLRGRLDISAVERSLNAVIARHPSLRTIFLHHGYEQPIQIALREGFADFEYRDIREECKAQPLSLVMDEYLKRDRADKFSLDKGPLMRLSVFQVNDEQYEFIWSHHHILMDGWCLGIIIKEFQQYYLHFKDGRDVVLPKAYPYVEYIEWLKSFDGNAALAYWKEYLSGYESLASLPKREEKDMTAAFDLVSSTVIIDKTLTRRLREVSVLHGVTINSIIQAAWGILLAKYNNADDVVFGSIVAGRPSDVPGVESMVGLFINAIPIRVTIQPEAAVGSLLKYVQNANLENEAQQYISLAAMQAASSLGAGLLDHIMIFEDYPVAEEIKDQRGMQAELGYSVHNVEVFEQTNYDLSIMVAPGEQITIRFDYNLNEYSKDVLDRAAAHLKTILTQIAADSSMQIGRIELTTEKERRQILSEFNNTRRDFDKELVFSELFRAQVQKTPLATAVEHKGVSLSYKELYERASAISVRLFADDNVPHKRVAIYMERGIDMLACILAAFQAGAAYVPVDIDYPVKRIHEILENSEAPVLLVNRNTSAEAEDLSRSLPQLHRIMNVDDLPSFNDEDLNEVKGTTDDLAYIIYTSGTSGKPKGVMVHQLGMINHLYAKIYDLNITDQTIIAQSASACFDISVWQFLAALLKGGKTHIIDKEILLAPKQLVAEIEESGITIFESVPSLLTTFLEELPSGERMSLGKLEWMIPTGESLSVALARKWYAYFPSVKLLNAYGPTEASDDVTHHIVVPPGQAEKVIPIGRPVQNTAIYILNKHYNLCPIGVKGEICVAGLGVGKGYWKDVEKTERAFVANPLPENEDADYGILYKTGDIGYYTATGEIVCMGRMDDQVKVRGLRIELGEIENRLLEHPLIDKAAVLAMKKNGDAHLVAYYQSEYEIPKTELKDFLLQSLPDYMVPAYFVCLESMPLTHNGKLDKKALPEFQPQHDVEGKRDTNEIEDALIEIWAELLSVEESYMHKDSNFFDLGGHSLKAITLANKIHKRFDVEIPLKEIFNKQTIENIADYLITVKQIESETNFVTNYIEVSI